MGPHGEALLDSCTTVTAILAGIGRWDRHHPTASVCCFADQDGPKLRPAGIRDALGEVGVADQVGHRQIFQIDGILGSYQPERRLVVKVPPLPLHGLVLLSQQLHRFLVPLAAFLPPRHPPLGFGQRLLGLAVMAGTLDHLTFRSDQKDLQPHINAHLLPSGRQRLDGHRLTGEADIPAVRFVGDGHGLDGAHDGQAGAFWPIFCKL
jgi:hypothetical protein